MMMTTEKQTAGALDGGYETPLTDAAIDRLVNAIRADGGLGYYLMVIKAGGKYVSFKASRKEIDGNHFYKHLFQCVTDDIREDIDPTLTVVPLPRDVVKELFKEPS